MLPQQSVFSVDLKRLNVYDNAARELQPGFEWMDVGIAFLPVFRTVGWRQLMQQETRWTSGPKPELSFRMEYQQITSGLNQKSGTKVDMMHP
jgi:hypothetical protein